jgi:hypothetical protein
MDRADVIRKAQKLMSYTDKTATPEEVANAADKLGRLMREYNLSMTDVTPSTLRGDIREQVFSTGFTVTMPPWYIRLAAGIAESIGCKFMVYDNNGAQARFIGSSVEVEIAVYFVSSLLPRLVDMSWHWPFIDKDQYLSGIADTIQARLAVMYAPPLQESSERGLMCLKRAAVSDYMEEIYPDVQNINTPAPPADFSYLHGRHHGHSIPLNQGLKAPDAGAPGIGDVS